MKDKTIQDIVSLIESYKIEDGIMFEDGLPPSDVLVDVYRDIRIVRAQVNAILDEIIKEIQKEDIVV